MRSGRDNRGGSVIPTELDSPEENRHAPMSNPLDGLETFLPVVAAWFRRTYGPPTPPQRLGWPSIASGQNTLIFAPTGSGKTLAAFLACLDQLWRVPSRTRGVQ